MDWKEFLRPTVWKAVLFVLLMGGLNYLIISNTVIFDAVILVGVPLGFYPIGSSPWGPVVEFSYLNFVIDLAVWYLVSCFLVLGDEKSLPPISRKEIFALLLSLVLATGFIIFVFDNLRTGTWNGFNPNQPLMALIMAALVGLYIFILSKFKFFGLSKK